MPTSLRREGGAGGDPRHGEAPREGAHPEKLGLDRERRPGATPMHAGPPRGDEPGRRAPGAARPRWASHRPREPPLSRRDKVMQLRNDYASRSSTATSAASIPSRERADGGVTQRPKGHLDPGDQGAARPRYACSIHKAQGGGPGGAVPIHTQHYLMLQRKTSSTRASTRARKLGGAGVGDKRALPSPSRSSTRPRRRYTDLAARLRKALMPGRSEGRGAHPATPPSPQGGGRARALPSLGLASRSRSVGRAAVPTPSAASRSVR